jgi:hypothetical protein
VCYGCGDACFWYVVYVFEGIVCWVVVGIASSVDEDSAEGGAIFGYRGFCEEEDIWVVGGYEGNDVGV